MHDLDTSEKTKLISYIIKPRTEDVATKSIVGTCLIRKNEDHSEDKTNFAELYFLYVDPDFRNIGLGRKMIEYLKQT